MKRIVIITEGHFPEGDAGANRLLYMAKAMVTAGFEVTVLCRGKYGDGRVDGIEYISFRERKSRTVDKVVAYLMFSRNVIHYLKKHTNVDCVYIYNAPTTVFEYCKRQAKAKAFSVVYDCVEWYSSEQFKRGVCDYNYRVKNRTVTQIVDTSFRVIAISSFLWEYFNSKGIRALRLPVMCEVNDMTTTKTSKEELCLFYAGSPQAKDLIGNTLEAALLLTPEERARLRLVFVGTTRTHLIMKCGIAEEVLDACADIIELYERKPRDKVLEMMRGADFVQLFRDGSLRYAKAGFPSKVVESLANATPILCNLSSDLGDYLRDGENALLADSHHPKDIAAAMRRALALSVEEKERMSRCALESAKEYFDYRNYVSEIKRFLQD